MARVPWGSETFRFRSGFRSSLSCRPMTRDAWIAAFVDELLRLRPYLRPSYGHSKLVLAMAAQAYATGEPDPVKAAREAHGRMAPPPSEG
jgi:hypothetical protein